MQSPLEAKFIYQRCKNIQIFCKNTGRGALQNFETSCNSIFWTYLSIHVKETLIATVPINSKDLNCCIIKLKFLKCHLLCTLWFSQLYRKKVPDPNKHLKMKTIQTNTRTKQRRRVKLLFLTKNIYLFVHFTVCSKFILPSYLFNGCFCHSSGRVYLLCSTSHFLFIYLQFELIHLLFIVFSE